MVRLWRGGVGVFGFVRGCNLISGFWGLGFGVCLGFGVQEFDWIFLKYLEFWSQDLRVVFLGFGGFVWVRDSGVERLGKRYLA